jgi:hypothetical protein
LDLISDENPNGRTNTNTTNAVTDRGADELADGLTNNGAN